MDGRRRGVRKEGGARTEQEGAGAKETQENEKEIHMKLQFTSNSFAPICTHTFKHTHTYAHTRTRTRTRIRRVAHARTNKIHSYA